MWRVRGSARGGEGNTVCVMLFIELVPVKENVATTRFKLRFETVAEFVALVNACNE